jgi:tRNA 5-methylaminomethyl-2-thiouridine biosynthesis bifunctional protein
VVQALQFPPGWTRYVSAQEASEIAGLRLNRGGIYFPTAARVDPQALLNALACTPGIEILRAEVVSMRQQGQTWQALDASGKVLASAPYAVLAGGFHTRAVLLQSGLLTPQSRLAAMHALGGEITFIPQSVVAGGPRCIVGGDGYLLPSLNGFCVAGSSYLHGAQLVSVTQEGVEGNLRRAAGLLNQPDLPGRLAGNALTGWAGWRAVLPGRLPAMGPVPHAQGLWVATGFASRGLTWATLAGDLIAGALNGEPIALENDIIAAVSGI